MNEADLRDKELLLEIEHTRRSLFQAQEALENQQMYIRDMQEGLNDLLEQKAKRDARKMNRSTITPIVFDGENPLVFHTVRKDQDWNTMAFRRDYGQCPEGHREEACSIVAYGENRDSEVALHWCGCGCIWLSGQGDPVILLSGDASFELVSKYLDQNT